MARGIINPTRPTRAGVTDVAEVNGDPTNGHVVANSGRTVVRVRNADASNPHSVTFVIPGTVDGQAIADRTVSIPASATRTFGSFPIGWYTQQLAIDADSSELKLTALEP